MTDLKGRSALVTGSTSGIGLGVATVLASKGANIMLNGFGDADEIEAMRCKVAADYGVQVAYSGADLTDEAQMRGLVNETAEKLGSVDILFNNAGVQHTDPVEKFPKAKWDLIMALMLTAPFVAIQEALPHMRKNGWGRIVNLASVHGLVGSPFKSAYVSAKHGLVGLTKVVGLETAQENITCNAICPGWVLTPLVQKQIDAIAEKEGLSPDEARVKLLAEKQPSLDFVKPEQVGELASFLCSDAAAQITGVAHSMDGGWLAR